MKKAVLASIKPCHTANILVGLKTLEIRKTVPNIPTPFRVYVYETLNGGKGAGEVVCEFLCDFFFSIDTEWMIHDELPGMPMETWLEWNDAPDEYETKSDIEKASCLTWKEIERYMGASPQIFCWHISELKIYGKPKVLSDFTPWCRFLLAGSECDHGKVACPYQDFDYNPWPDCSVNVVTCRKRMTKPPQSWCYVEEVSGC